jgi:hypothetical protein
MAILPSFQFNNIDVVGDGTSTTATIDMTDHIKSAGILPKIPSSILSISNADGIPAISSFTLSGSTVSVVFTTAPTADTQIPLSITLVF